MARNRSSGLGGAYASEQKPPCSIADCGRAAFCRGWCTRHYQRWRKHGSASVALRRVPGESLFERLHSGTDRSAGADGCWFFGHGDGYHVISQWDAGAERHVNRPAHRVAYEEVNGPIPNGLVVRHDCDTRACVNPRHLRIGTTAQNAQDAVERDRVVFGERNHKAKLNDLTVRLIRNLHANGETQVLLAKRFGVRQTSISRVVLRQTWRRVA